MKEVCVKEVHGKEDRFSEDRFSEDRFNEDRFNEDCTWPGQKSSFQGQVRVLGVVVLLLAAAWITLASTSHMQPYGQASLTPTPASPLQTISANPDPAVALERSSKARVTSVLNGLPLMFEPNLGQADASVKFLARGVGSRGLGYGVFLTADGATMSLVSRKDSHSSSRVEALRMKLTGSNPHAVVTGISRLPGKTNYLIGNDPSQWHHDVPQFARVRYENIYPGINLVFYGNHGQMEYDFQVAPGSDPAQAELEFDGSKGIELRDGNLILHAEGGDVRLQAPHVYQRIGDRDLPVGARFQMRAANRVGFALGSYDRSRELIIDPVLDYSTYFGGSGDEHSTSIAVDNVGDIYLTGSTDSVPSSFPPATAQTLFPPTLTMTPPNTHVYVAKISPSISTPAVYETFLGGTGSESPVGIAVDGGGNAYIAGTTSSTDFPTTATNAYQAAPQTGSKGTTHVFVSVLNSVSGSLLNYSSYLSGNGTDTASGMAIDASGDVFVTGTTTSTDSGASNDQFPVTSPPEPPPFQQFSRAPIQFFVTKVKTTAFGIGSIAYSTYFGGGTPSNGTAVGGGVAVDGSGNIYFSGTTNFLFTGQSSATDFPIINAYQPCLDQAPPATNVNPQSCTYNPTPTATDAFVAKLNPNNPPGTQLLWSTYLGGTQTDSSTGIAIDSGAANVYITGTTNSTDVTTLTSFAAYQICLDTPLNPTTGKAGCSTTVTNTDAYVARLNNPSSAVGALTYFSYLGGSGNDAGLAIAVDSASDALITGWTQSPDLCMGTNPCAPVGQGGLNGPQDAFFAHLNTTTVSGQNTVGGYAFYFGGSGTDQGTSVTVDSSLNTYFAGDTNSPDLQTAKALQTANAGGFDAFAVKLSTAADLGVTGVLTLGTNQTYVSAGNQATFTYTVTNNGPDLATQVTISDDLSTAVTGIPLTFVSATAGSGSCSSTTTNSTAVCTIASLQSGSTSTVTIVVTPTVAGNFNGGTVTVFSPGNNDPNPANNVVTPPVSGKASDFSVAVNPANQSIPAAGDTAKYVVTVSPINPYASSIALSCSSGVPTAASCTFSTSSVTLPNLSPATSQLSISTTARPVTVVASTTNLRQFYALWLSLPGMAVIGFSWKAGRGRRITAIILGCALFGLILLQPACSSKSTTTPVSGTPPGTYTLVLTATSGSDTKNSTVTLTVP